MWRMSDARANCMAMKKALRADHSQSVGQAESAAYRHR
jgi:hypothetical protein